MNINMQAYSYVLNANCIVYIERKFSKFVTQSTYFITNVQKYKKTIISILQ